MAACEMIGAHLFMMAPRPKEHDPTISDQMDALIMSLLDKDPSLRPQTARELSARLTEVAQAQAWITSSSPSGVTAPALVPLIRPTPRPRLSTRWARPQLAAVYIVSNVELRSDDGVSEPLVEVLPPAGAKCGRSWNWLPTVGAHADHPELCARCHSVVVGLS